VGAAKKAVMEWTYRDHRKYWDSSSGLKQAKGLIQGPSTKRKKLLKINRNQL
jgi:hypothetical protein